MTHRVSRDDDERYALARRELADAIAALVPFEANEDLDRGVLTAWTCIAELEAPDGNRWLTLVSGNGSGSNDLPAWTLRAFGHELREWAVEVDDDEDVDE